MAATTSKAAKVSEKRPKHGTGRARLSPKSVAKARRPLGRTSRSAQKADSGDAEIDPRSGAGAGVGPGAGVGRYQDAGGAADPGSDPDVSVDGDAEKLTGLAGERSGRALAPDVDDLSGAAESAARRPRRLGRARNQNADEPASFLAIYFREMAALDVLRPEQEFEAAREIESLEIGVWEKLLSFAPAVDYVLKAAETCMENSIAEFRSLRRVANDARKSPQAARARLERAARKCAEKLRALDTDRIYLEAVLAELDRIRRDVPGRIVSTRLSFDPDQDEFRSYLRAAVEANRAAEEARNAFVKANLRLVVSIARRFNHGRMALADLIQEGNIGLMKAVERYDYRRGFRFSTYASWWIRHAISRALADKGREVRLPVHMIDAYHRISKAKRELTAKLGRQPTSEELAEATNIASAKIEKMRTYLVDQSFSLDRPVNDEDGRHFIEFLQDPSFEEGTPADRLSMQAMTDEVRVLLRDLKPIEADILRQRFGLDDDRELTLKEIGEKYNLSRERIRQLQEQALSKMRRALARKDML